MKKIYLFFIAINFLNSCVDHEAKRCTINNFPDANFRCPTLEDMKKRWVGTYWSGHGTIDDVKSGPDVKESTDFVDCCYDVTYDGHGDLSVKCIQNHRRFFFFLLIGCCR